MDMHQRLSSAFGRTIVSYPFMVMAAAVLVGIEIADRARGGGFVGWTMWVLLWLGLAAFAAGIVIIPLPAAEVLLWSFVEDRLTWLRDTWPGVVVSALVLAAPWGAVPRVHPGGILLIAAGLILARAAVPSLRPGRDEAGA